jgi:glutamate-1-semialdehyde 2,1-aminomutase
MRTVADLHTAYTERFPRSAAWAETARMLLPGGVAHDGRAAEPFPLAFEAADGAGKRDLDGNEVIDYWMGHGALMLGHNPPAVVRALAEQIGRGTHLGGGHPAEVRWARRIVELVPSAERVRFVASGTEATLMALRIARAVTGRSRIVRFEGHFHGWHDWVAIGNRYPFDRPSSGGVPPSVRAEIVVLPNNDVAAAERALVDRDVAAVILEPGGGTQGRVATTPDFLRSLREMTVSTGTPLIFDEVVTGFRISPGGVQAAVGIDPDLTTLAKIVAGGLPGGAVCGRAALMDQLSFDPPSGRQRVAHPGTFNGNPLTAVAGTAMLEAIAGGEVLDAAAKSAGKLRAGLNDLMSAAGVPGYAYGDRSIIHVLLGGPGERLRRVGGDPTRLPPRDLLTTEPVIASGWRTACLYHGLDLMGPTMMVSSAHGHEVVRQSLDRFRAVFETLQMCGVIPRVATGVAR